MTTKINQQGGNGRQTTAGEGVGLDHTYKI